jgi:hypothetical protein
MRALFMAGVAALALALPAGPASGADSNLHYTLLEPPARAFPTRLVLLPPQVIVKEVSTGGIADLVPEWIRLANANIQEELRAGLAARPDLTLLPMPDLAAGEGDRIEQYLATYMVVGVAAHWATNAAGTEWAHKRRHFDYTLGEGLDFLRARTGADAAVMVIGEDYVSSSGRKAARMVGTLLGMGVAGGASIISVGVVDLGNGDILWLHHNQSTVNDLKDREAVKAMLADILAALPGPAGRVALR